MFKTKRKLRKQISDLSFDIEIINPIESKSLFGGCDYCDNPYHNIWDLGWLNEVTITPTNWWTSNNGNNVAINTGFDMPGGDGSQGHGGDSWLDIREDANNDGINDADQTIPNLPQTVPLQLDQLGSCVSYAISFISNYLGKQTNPLSVAFNIDNILGLPNNIALMQSTAFSSGLNPAQATQAIQSYFITNQLNNIQQVTTALQAGHPVIANYITSPATPQNGNTITAHEIVIVDYNQWNFYIANSLTGSYQWISHDLIAFQNGAYEITGIKP